MSCKVLYDDEEDIACLYDSGKMIAFGRVFKGSPDRGEAISFDADEAAEAFFKWYGQSHPDREPSTDPNLVEVQDVWLKTLDRGCYECGAAPWEHCDEYVEEHERQSEAQYDVSKGCSDE
jgi:hypothetical protein